LSFLFWLGEALHEKFKNIIAYTLDGVFYDFFESLICAVPF